MSVCKFSAGAVMAFKVTRIPSSMCVHVYVAVDVRIFHVHMRVGAGLSICRIHS